jgi:transcriptional regulator with PAS, ATPase and Fis domain
MITKRMEHFYMSKNYSFPDSFKYLNAFLIADLVDLPMHIINNEGVIIFVNNAWSKLYKVNREDAVDKSIQEIISSHLNYLYSVNEEPLNDGDKGVIYKQVKEQVTQSIAIRVLKERKKLSMITTTPDDEDRKILVTSTPIFNEKSEIVYVITVVQDLSKISELKDQLDAQIEQNKMLSEKLKSYKDDNKSGIIGSSKKITEIKKLVPVVAKTDAAILILGESGVGKEVLAKEIFKNSNRKDKPFVTINCAAIPEHLLESEMFGYEKGAFTGAVKSKEGLFETANSGTIMLDEIGTMPLSLQPKLLRVLQENEFMRVGGTKKIPLDVRIISATNENLLTLIKTGEFRQDLYYRLNVIPIKIPPLRERKEDIRLLCYKFLEDFNKKYSKNKIFNEKSLLLLEQYDWPGNIRELKNAIERLVILGERDVICANQVNKITKISGNENSEIEDNIEIDDSLSLKEAVQALEKRIITLALTKYKTTYKAAEVLKTTQPTIVRKAKALGIEKTWVQ